MPTRTWLPSFAFLPQHSSPPSGSTGAVHGAFSPYSLRGPSGSSPGIVLPLRGVSAMRKLQRKSRATRKGLAAFSTGPTRTCPSFARFVRAHYGPPSWASAPIHGRSSSHSLGAHSGSSPGERVKSLRDFFHQRPKNKSRP